MKLLVQLVTLLLCVLVSSGLSIDKISHNSGPKAVLSDRDSSRENIQSHDASTRNPCRYKQQEVSNDLGSEKKEALDALFRKERLNAYLTDRNQTELCIENKAFCYSLWQQPTNGTKSFIKQGCWDHPSEPNACKNTSCIAYRHVSQIPDSYFCCCTGPNCNLDVHVGKLEEEDDYAKLASNQVVQYLADPDYKQRTIMVAMSSVVSVALVTALAYLFYRLWGVRHSNSTDSHPHDQVYGSRICHDMPRGSMDQEGNYGFTSAFSTYDISTLKLKRRLGRGRYGDVWKAVMHGRIPVAAKLFHATHECNFRNECEIYQQPLMEHWAVTKFVGACEGSCPERLQPGEVNESDSELEGESNSLNQVSDDPLLMSPRCFVLVMSYIPGGSLTQYLKENTIDWATLCKMLHSIAAGLAHIHADITKHGVMKPSIVHRDINTRNILVRTNLTCVICDFGLAMCVSGNKAKTGRGGDDGGEQPSIRDVGTLRYMAPEVLEGAVNLRDCAASLKQIDVYALGLVMWEVASRCHELYQGLPVPLYQLPYQTELGGHPTFEQMQQTVVVKKIRPAMPDVWKDTNLAIRALKETLEDCWDHDAEARLTALCVKERVNDFANLWEARSKGVSATINQTMSPSDDETGVHHILPPGTAGDELENYRNAVYTRHNTPSSTSIPGALPYMRLLSTNTGIGGGSEGVGSSSSGIMGEVPMSCMSVQSLSTATTDTLLSPTATSEGEMSAPALPPHFTKANCNLFVPNRPPNRVNKQPCHGANPVAERNTHKNSDEQLTVMGNSLIDRRKEEGSMATLERRYKKPPERFDDVAGRLETSLVQSDVLSRQIEAAVASDAPRNVPRDADIDETQGLMSETLRPKMYNTDIQVADGGCIVSKDRANHKSSVWQKLGDFFNRKKTTTCRNKENTMDCRKSVECDCVSSSINHNDEESYPTENLCVPEPGVTAATNPNPVTDSKSNLHPRPTSAHTSVNVSTRSSGGGSGSGSLVNHPPRPASMATVGTEVCLLNGVPIVRPASLSIVNHMDNHVPVCPPVALSPSSHSSVAVNSHNDNLPSSTMPCTANSTAIKATQRLVGDQCNGSVGRPALASHLGVVQNEQGTTNELYKHKLPVTVSNNIQCKPQDVKDRNVAAEQQIIDNTRSAENTFTQLNYSQPKEALVNYTLPVEFNC